MSSTYKIDFEAKLKNLTELEKVLGQIVSTTRLNLAPDLKTQILNIQKQISAMYKAIQSEGSLLSDTQIKDYLKDFGQIKKIVSSFTNELLKAQLSPKLQAQLDESLKKISDADKKIKDLRKAAKDKLAETGTKLVGNSAVATKTTKDKIARDTASANKVDNVNTYAQLKKIDSPEAKKALQQYDEQVKKLELDATKAFLDIQNQIIATSTEQENLNKLVSEISKEEGVSTYADKQAESLTSLISIIMSSFSGALQEIVDKENAAKKAIEEETKETKKQEEAKKAVAKAAKEAADAAAKEEEKQRRAEKDRIDTISALSKTQQDNSKATNLHTETIKANTSTLSQAARNVFTYSTALHILRSAYQQCINTITEMDKALTSMTVVTNLTREQA